MAKRVAGKTMDGATASGAVSPFDENATISTGHLSLIPLQPEDADELAPVLDDERLHEFIGGRTLPLADLRSRYAGSRRAPPTRTSYGSTGERIWRTREADRPLRTNIRLSRSRDSTFP